MELALLINQFNVKGRLVTLVPFVIAGAAIRRGTARAPES